MTTSRPVFAEHEFRKAARSNPDRECVRVARGGGRVELRDDKVTFGAADDHRLVFTEAQFDAFLAGARAGDTEGLCLAMTRRADGSSVFADAAELSLELVFTASEVEAFLGGVARREFDATAFAV